MLLHSVVLALTSGLVLAGPLSPVYNELQTKREVPSTHSLHERHLPLWSHQWTRKSKVPDTRILPMRVGLKQRNLEAGHDKLMDISTPGSENYGNHMTAEEIIDFFAPSPSTTDAITEWLVASGISADRFALSVNKQWIQFDATVAEVEELLIADFYVWEHSSGTQDISSEEYHVPTHIQEHIDYITPGTRLRQRNTKKARLDKLAKRFSSGVRPFITQLPAFPNPNATNCDIYVTAECTRVQYNIPNATKAENGNELGIYESLDVHYSRADLDIYFSTLYPHIPNGTYPQERLIDGAIGAIEDTKKYVPIDLEAPLDFDASQPLIYPQKLVLFQEDDEYYESTGNFNGFWNTFLDAIDGSYCTYSAYGETGDCTVEACLDPAYPDPNPGGYKGKLQCGVYKPTNVISISYGGGEESWPDYYMKRQCNEWMKLALQGTTIVMSSGDSGVGGNAGSCNGASGDIFTVDFASSCPYVLSVGSTEWDRFNASVAPIPGQKLKEIATRRFPSGGGFSNVFPQPSYQSEAVSTYFKEVGSSLGFEGYTATVTNGDFSNVTSGVYKIGGRAYPDVGAVGDRQVVYSNGSWWLVGGTSLSAPVWGAVLNLVNEERISRGKSSVGFVHPVLYEHPEAFNDVVNGSNPGCGSEGFLAAKGWDPVTGLGSPNFPVLLDVLLNC